MYPADDAVALIKMVIQRLKKNEATLSEAPSNGFTPAHAWHIVFRNEFQEVGNIVADITTRRDSITANELTVLVDRAIELLLPS